MLDRIRLLGFERIPSPTLLIFYKRAVSRPVRWLYRVQDAVDAMVTDAGMKLPLLRRALSVYRVPPPHHPSQFEAIPQERPAGDIA
jgi:hypothetical protein